MEIQWFGRDEIEGRGHRQRAHMEGALVGDQVNREVGLRDRPQREHRFECGNTTAANQHAGRFPFGRLDQICSHASETRGRAGYLHPGFRERLSVVHTVLVRRRFWLDMRMAIRLRPVTAADEAAIAEFLAGLSLRSFALRFFSAGVDAERAAHQIAQVDGHDSVGLIAEDDGRVVGHAMYVRTKPNAVEAAFAVADEMQCHGLGSVMVACIADLARTNGFDVLEAEVLPENHRMLDVFAESGFPLQLRAEPGVVHVTAQLSGGLEWHPHTSLDTTVRNQREELSITRLPG